jgi:hypothetical protein
LTMTKEKPQTFTVRLFNPGFELPVAVYNHCLEAHTREDAKVLVFTRASGQEVKTNMAFEVTVE